MMELIVMQAMPALKVAAIVAIGLLVVIVLGWLLSVREDDGDWL
jgi:hypothetical protein